LVNHHAFLAHAKSVLRFKEIIPDGNIGASFAYSPSYALNADPIHAMSKMEFDNLKNFWWMDVYDYGRYPEIIYHYFEINGVDPQVTSEDVNLVDDDASLLDTMLIRFYHNMLD